MSKSKAQTTEPAPIDLEALDALAAEARETIATLEPREAALSLDVLGDPSLAGELRDCQEQRGRAEGVVRQAALARQELERRAAERMLAEEAARTEAARLEALRLQTERVAAAAEVDEGCAVLAQALTRYGEIVSRQTLPLVAAGRRQLHIEEGGTQRALFRALMDAGTPAGLVNWPGSHRMGAAPFAGLDPVPIYPDARETPAPEGSEPDTDPELVSAGDAA
jgi:hypothetical protein